ncbi:potassium channel family protein [Halosegnis sp.]|uniref:potassium channel family protein n=1 Tax=Halosegnis sp. TaxID=2864959 RepID=UPI0035D453F9
METWRRRITAYVVGLLGVILLYAIVYDAGMTAFDGRPRTFLQSLQVVVETFTTTGFGSDAPWQSPQMTVLVILMDLTGVALIFLALPALVFPLLEDALSTTVPDSVEGLADHVIVCGFSPRSAVLIEELDANDVAHVIVEPDRDRATDLYEDGHTVIHAAPDETAGLLAANVTEARAVVADVSDEIDTSIVLTAREVAEDVTVVSVVEEPDRARYHELAGADEVLSPRALLGESLARKVTTAVSTELGETIEVGEEFDIVEFPVRRGSELVGQTLAESGLRERAGVNVIGAWFEGEFQSPPDPSATLTGGTVLLVTGREPQLERLKELTLAGVRQFGAGETLVLGYGEVGRKVVGALDTAGLPHTVVDREAYDGVDVVGDVTEPATLERAGLADGRSVVLAVGDDTVAEFATLVCRDAEPDVEILARAEGIESVRKIYRAGADYVLSLASITGRMAASAVLDEEVIALDTQVEVVRTEAPALAGETLGGADVRARTGCTVVAVERDGEVVTNLGPDYRVRETDTLIIAGTDEGINRFTELLG